MVLGSNPDPRRTHMAVPDLLTIEEAAAVLRVGRTTAYELANRDLATGGGEGLGVVRVGRLLRVRRSSLEALVGGPLTVVGTNRDAPGDTPALEVLVASDDQRAS
jgi:excisionase family DNA binding protein